MTLSLTFTSIIIAIVIVPLMDLYLDIVAGFATKHNPTKILYLIYLTIYLSIVKKLFG